MQRPTCCCANLISMCFHAYASLASQYSTLVSAQVLHFLYELSILWATCVCWALNPFCCLTFVQQLMFEASISTASWVASSQNQANVPRQTRSWVRLCCLQFSSVEPKQLECVNSFNRLCCSAVPLVSAVPWSHSRRVHRIAGGGNPASQD